MQTQEKFTIKNYTDIEGLESNVQRCTLFLHFGANNLKAVVASKSKNAIYSLKIIESKEKNIFKSSASDLKSLVENLYPFEFETTKIIIDNNRHSIVPEPLFAGDKAESYLKLNTVLDKNFKVLYNRIGNNKVSVFALNEDFYKSVISLFPHSEIIHETQLMMIFLSETNFKNDKETLFVNVHDSYIEVAQLKNSALNYYNTFRAEADTDIIYFVLSVAELQKLNPEKLHIILFGDVSNTGSLPALMKKYIPDVELLKRPETYSYPASFREFQEQQNYLPICSLLCE